jgi:hypothetical protein
MPKLQAQSIVKINPKEELSNIEMDENEKFILMRTSDEEKRHKRNNAFFCANFVQTKKLSE